MFAKTFSTLTLVAGLTLSGLGYAATPAPSGTPTKTTSTKSTRTTKASRPSASKLTTPASTKPDAK